MKLVIQKSVNPENELRLIESNNRLLRLDHG